MRTILVDVVNAFVVETENGFEIFEPKFGWSSMLILCHYLFVKQ